MVFGDNPPSDIVATSSFKTALLTVESRRSPIFGQIHFLRQPLQFSKVEGATGFRFRCCTLSSHIKACCLKVRPRFLSTTLTTLLKYCSVSAPLSTMILSLIHISEPT